MLLYLKFKFGNRGGGVGWGEVISKKLGKIKLIFKNLGSGFGGPKSPLLYPSVYNNVVSYTSHTRSPEIPHLENCGFAPKNDLFYQISLKFPMLYCI